MKNTIRHTITGGLVAVMAVLGLVVVPAQTALAGSPASQVQTGVNGAGGSGQAGLQASVQIVINILLFVIGAVSVIMIILGGIRYVLSNGDSSQITGAKNTILYSVIGLVVALLAYAIVNFVVVQFT